MSAISSDIVTVMQNMDVSASTQVSESVALQRDTARRVGKMRGDG